MAKPKTPNARKAYSALDKRAERYVALIKQVYDTYNREAAKIALRTSYDGDKPFSFSDYPETAASVKKLRKEFAGNIETVITNAITNGWRNADKFNDNLVKSVLKQYGEDVRAEELKNYLRHDNPALKAFIVRKDKGMNLSSRVWNQSGDYIAELEAAISVSMEERLSAAEMSRKIRECLNEPHKLFRRVRDMYGDLQLSKPAMAYHPGQGVYRSSYKNAMRLCRTEVNMAYRTADNNRWSNLDFVVGMEVKRSRTEYDCPVCDSLKGKYPKDFLFVGWHPQCRCYQISILKTEEEFWDDDGTETSVNEVTDVPEGFKKWVAENAKRIAVSEYKGTTPYFLLDNSKYVNLDSFKATKLQKFTVDSRNEYLHHDKQKWQRDYFNRENGGYLVVDKERIEHSKLSKNEKSKFNKEYEMCTVLARNGYKIEMLIERPGFSSSDITINGIMADLKKTAGVGNIEKYANKAIKRQGAELIVFEFAKETEDIYTKLLKLSKNGMHGYYYFSDNKNKIFEF
jgi:hypothetical protein